MKFSNKGIIFTDRDGVIIKEVEYLSLLSQIEIYENAVEALRLFNNEGYHTLVLSNQSGVARGFFPLEFVTDCHLFIQNQFRNHNAHIDQFYFCPHHPEGSVPEFSISCECRKPKTGLVQRALKEFPADLNKCYMIGDKLSDVQTGINAGIQPILVKTGYGENTAHENRVFLIENNVWICEDILDAAKKILNL